MLPSPVQDRIIRFPKPRRLLWSVIVSAISVCVYVCVLQGKTISSVADIAGLSYWSYTYMPAFQTCTSSPAAAAFRLLLWPITCIISSAIYVHRFFVVLTTAAEGRHPVEDTFTFTIQLCVAVSVCSISVCFSATTTTITI